jgi:hypothetical protein
MSGADTSVRVARKRSTFGGSRRPDDGLASKAHAAAGGWGSGEGPPAAPGASPYRPGHRSLESTSEPLTESVRLR